MLYTMGLPYDGALDILDINNIGASNIGCTPPPALSKNSALDYMLKSLLPIEVRVFLTIDDIRLRSNSTTDKTIEFTKKSLFYTKLGFTQSHLGC